MSEQPQNVSIKFLPDRTVAYSDSEGTLKFAFDPGPLGEKVIVLYRGALDVSSKLVPKTVSNSERIEYAFERIVEYLRSLGFAVTIV